MDEILDAAQAQLTKGGFAALSVAGIARELGVAQNSVYWYFGSKDEIFAAAFRRLLTRLVDKKPPAGANRIDTVLWVTDQMADLAPLRADLQDRAAHSQAASELVLQLDGWIGQLLLGPGRPDDIGQVFLAAVDGILALRRSRSDRRRLVKVAFDQLLGSSGLSP